MNTANPGSTLQRFGSRSPLRNHGVGTLFEAQDLKGHGRVALREIPLEAMGESAVNALGQLPHHPGLPGVVGSGREGDMAWVALEFPNGKLLSAVGRPLEPVAWAKMGTAIASALEAAHAGGVVHGELTNDSVLMCGDRVLLYDLPLVLANRLTDRRGEARLLAQLPQMVSYLAPERFKGLEPTAASDVYSLAVLLCIAAGADPAPGESALERIHRVTTLAWRPTLPLHLPQVHTLLIRMMATDPGRRPAMRDVSAQLQALLEQLGVKPVRRAVADPFDALVATGVTARRPDPHAIPTKQVQVVLEPGPTAPGRGQPPPPEARRTPPAAVTAPSQMTVPTEPARPPVPTPSGKRRTPVPPMLDVNVTGKLWHLEPIAPPLPATKRQPPVLHSANQTQPFGADEVEQALARVSTAPSMASVAAELPLVVGAVVEVEAPKPPVPSPVRAAAIPLTQVVEPAVEAAPAVKSGEPTNRIKVLTEEKTDTIEPVAESDEQLAAALVSWWRRPAFVVPVAALLVLGVGAGLFWQFGPSLSMPSSSLPSISSLLPSSLTGGSDEEQLPRRRRTVRPNSIETVPAAPVAPEAVPAEANAAEVQEKPAEIAAAPEAEAEKKTEPAAAAANADEEDSDEADAAPTEEAAVHPAPPAVVKAAVKKPAPAPRVIAAPKPAPRPHPVVAKRGPDFDSRQDTPAIEEKPAARAEPSRTPSKLGDDDP